MDETEFTIDFEYATCFNSVIGQDYFYAIMSLTMPKPADEYSQFTLMLYTQIITSDDNPILHLATTPTFETVSMTSPFYNTDAMETTLWMLNQYKYTQYSEQGVEPNEVLYSATGSWNDQMADDKIPTVDSEGNY